MGNMNGIAFFNILNDGNELDNVRLSVFDGVVGNSRSAPSFQLLPYHISANLLTSQVAKQYQQEIVMRVPKSESDDCYLRLTAIPLSMDDPSTMKTCILGGAGANNDYCSVLVDASQDYNVQVWNEGRIADNVQLYFRTPELGGKFTLGQEPYSKASETRSSIEYGTLGVFAMLIITEKETSAEHYQLKEDFDEETTTTAAGL